MDTALQNLLTDGTATLPLEKLMMLVEQSDKAKEFARTTKAEAVEHTSIVVRQLIGYTANLAYTLGKSIMTRTQDKEPGLDAVEVVHHELGRLGYIFKYTVNPSMRPAIIITEINKIP